MTLRARVAAGFVLVAVTLAVVAFVITTTTRSDMIAQIDRQLAGAVGPVRDFDRGYGQVPPSGPSGGPPPETGPPRGLTSVYVGEVEEDTVNTIVAPNLRGEDNPLPVIDADAAREAAATGEPFTVPAETGGGSYRVLAYEDGRADDVVVLALPLDSVDDTISTLVTVELIGGAVIFAVLALVAWWVIHLGIRPVKRMTVVATAIAEGDLSQRVPDADVRTEAGQLGAALNRMLAQIEAAFDERTRADQRLRRFVADASHELRTPIATIRGYAELYRTGGLTGEGELDDAMRRSEQEAVRMAALVDDLLNLARLDEGRPLELAPVDITRLAEDAAGDARAVDPEREVTTTSDGSLGPLTVVGDEARLRQVVGNLVVNALVHTPPGTAVEIRTRAEGGDAVVEVADHGPGMPPDVAERAFERFYRADPARSRHRGGSGLGLSIVESAVHAHGGTATIHSVPGEGTTVRVRLPLTPDAASRNSEPTHR